MSISVPSSGLITAYSDSGELSSVELSVSQDIGSKTATIIRLSIIECNFITSFFLLSTYITDKCPKPCKVQGNIYEKLRLALQIFLSLTLALEDGEGVKGEGFHFVFAWETADRGEEDDALAEAADDIL